MEESVTPGSCDEGPSPEGEPSPLFPLPEGIGDGGGFAEEVAVGTLFGPCVMV